MAELLFSLAALSLGGGVAIVLLAFLSRSTRARYGARWRCWAWLLLALRLAIPLPLLPHGQGGDIQAPIQLPAPTDGVIYQRRPAAPSGGDQPFGTEPSQSQTQAAPPTSSSSHAQSGQSLPAQSQEGDFTLTLSHVLLFVWLMGAAAMAARLLLSHLRFLRYLRRWARRAGDPETLRLYNRLGDQLSLARRPHLMVCPGLASPMLAGLLRPVLLLPQDALLGDPLRYSLLHELIHYRRRDIWLKALALWVNVLHWFNPLVWYMVRLVERDTELACDEGVLSHLPQAEHTAYGRTILDAVGRLGRPAVQPGAAD